jgi:predicted alpha/beta-hydrolase family hydrolase
MTRVRGLLLTPGAGSAADHHTLVAIERAVKPMPTLRHDFPYRRSGRKAPDRAPVLLADLTDAATAFAKKKRLPASSLVLGGRSMGGRICSMAVAGGLPAAGLILISYPLHPPGKPEKLRVEHLPALEVPCLFVSGTRDAFGTPEELEKATSTIPGPVTHVWVDRGTHELKNADDQIVEAVTGWLGALA